VVLRKIRHHIDFEGLANHRGSAFGRDALDHQPAVIDWERSEERRVGKECR